MSRHLTVPKGYREFQCAGKDCPETCCGGWEIRIDRKTMKRYKVLRREGFDFRNAVDFHKGWLMMKNGSCPLLTQGLCRIHRDLGEEYLCHTCGQYPRHKEEYGELCELSLSLSCPVAARMILGSQEELKLRHYILNERQDKRGKGKNFQDFGEKEKEILTCLLKARSLMMSLLSRRERPLGHRLSMVLALSCDFQSRLKAGNRGEMEKVLKRYARLESHAGYEWFQRKAAFRENRLEERYDSMAGFLSLLGELYEIYPGYLSAVSDWMDRLYRTEEGFPDYERQVETGWREERFYENLAAYLLYIYVPGAVYDRDVKTKVKFILFSLLCIREAAILFPKERRGDLSDSEREDVLSFLTSLVYRYSRQVEHSDENLYQIEKALRENKNFSMEAFLRNLLN